MFGLLQLARSATGDPNAADAFPPQTLRLLTQDPLTRPCEHLQPLCHPWGCYPHTPYRVYALDSLVERHPVNVRSTCEKTKVFYLPQSDVPRITAKRCLSVGFVEPHLSRISLSLCPNS